MKVIAVFEKPHGRIDCPFFRATGADRGICLCDGHTYSAAEYFGEEKEEKCPLKPMPLIRDWRKEAE